MTRKKLIEVALPLEAINEASAREKSIRHGHPSTLHLWWARRPLAACRAVIFASLVDDPDDPEASPEFVEACRQTDPVLKCQAHNPGWRNALTGALPEKRPGDFQRVQGGFVRAFGVELKKDFSDKRVKDCAPHGRSNHTPCSGHVWSALSRGGQLLPTPRPLWNRWQAVHGGIKKFCIRSRG